MSDSSGDRTETASARRLQKAREDGDVPVSRELGLLAGLAGGTGMLAFQIITAGAAPVLWFGAMLQRRGVPPEAALADAVVTVARAMLPAACGAAGAAAAATLLQTGFLLRIAALQPDLSRISPLRGIKRLLSVETLLQAGKSAAKLAVLSFGLWLALHRLLPVLPVVPRWSQAALARAILAGGARLVGLLAGAQALLALFDVFLVHLRYAARMRMTRQEQRDEHKEAEGNPQVKQRLRQLGRQRARRRMMAAVRRATVIVTNPTHYAVALAYERGSKSAPRVVAKGADDVADRIRAEARTYNIPVVANPPLTRALYRIELDTEIPVEHFKAVAEIVAYVWRLQTRRTL
jgi:flagellar biosynthetic protein FlhB